MKRFGFAVLAFVGLNASIAAEASPAFAAESEPAPAAAAMTCAGEQSLGKMKVCLPPTDFVKKMCAASYPDATLSLFAKGTPWTRMWLTGDIEAWNANGGLTSRANLAFDEEVIVLSRHASPGGIQMSSGGSLDVLRWDGSCVSVQEGELTAKRPPAPKPAAMRWHRFETATQKALLSSAKVKATRDAADKACSGEKTACDRAEQESAMAIAQTVRGGATLPAPAKRPQ